MNIPKLYLDKPRDVCDKASLKAVKIRIHHDLEYQCLECREEKTSKFIFFVGKRWKELIFPINAKTLGPQNHEVASEIMEVNSSALPNSQPVGSNLSSTYRIWPEIMARVLQRKECLKLFCFLMQFLMQS